MEMLQLHPAEQICAIMKLAYQRHMVSSAGGCLSIRDDEGNMWISPTSQDKGDLKPDIIAEYSKDGKLLSEYKGSMEWDNHLAIYNERPDVRAIFHTHSSGVLSTVFARKAVRFKSFASESVLVRNIAEIPFNVPGGKELCDNIVKAVKAGNDILTLDSHGTYVLSEKSLLEAFKIQDAIEMASRAETIAPAIGNLLPELSDHQIDEYGKMIRGIHFESYENSDEADNVRDLRREFCNYIARGYENGVIDCRLSDFSVRIGDDDFLITPENGNITAILPEDLVRVKSGKVEENKKVSYRAALHREIYNSKSFVGSILSNVSSYASAYCITDAVFDCSIDPELTFCVKGVKKYKFMSSSQEIANGFEKDSQAAIIENDCIVSASVNPVKTLGIAECLEYATRAVTEMSIQGRKPIQITEYRK